MNTITATQQDPRVVFLHEISLEEREAALLAAMKRSSVLDQEVIEEASFLGEGERNFHMAYLLIKVIRPAMIEHEEVGELFDWEEEIKLLIQAALPDAVSVDDYIRGIEQLDEEREALIAEDEGVKLGYRMALESLREKGKTISLALSAGASDVETATAELARTCLEALPKIEVLAKGQAALAERLLKLSEKAEGAARKGEAVARHLSQVAQDGVGVLQGVASGPSTSRR